MEVSGGEMDDEPGGRGRRVVGHAVMAIGSRRERPCHARQEGEGRREILRLFLSGGGCRLWVDIVTACERCFGVGGWLHAALRSYISDGWMV